MLDKTLCEIKKRVDGAAVALVADRTVVRLDHKGVAHRQVVESPIPSGDWSTSLPDKGIYLNICPLFGVCSEFCNAIQCIVTP